MGMFFFELSQFWIIDIIEVRGTRGSKKSPHFN